MKINTINELIEMVQSGKISVDVAAESAIENRLEYAIKNFNPALLERAVYSQIYKRYWEIKPKATSNIVAVPAAAIRADCGHVVAQSQIMNSSRGTCCPDCYDRMSESK